jgi:hypothetical protein
MQSMTAHTGGDTHRRSPYSLHKDLVVQGVIDELARAVGGLGRPDGLGRSGRSGGRR